MVDVEAVEAAADLYTHMDLAHGNGMATAMAQSSLRWAAGLLSKEMTNPTRERLCSAVGLLADRLGWSVYDRGDGSRAEHLLTFALEHSALGADRDLRAHVLLDMSTVRTDGGHPLDGVDILRFALGDERISSAEQANLHAVCARHCGTAGDREAGLRHVGLAEEVLEQAEPAVAPKWARRITTSAGHLDSALGLALFTLGEDRWAFARLSAALTTLDSGRTRTGLRCRTRLAVLHIRQGDRAEGEAAARRTVSDAAGVQSIRVAGDLQMMIDGIRGYGLESLANDLRASLSA